jgi:hypothetical protein
MLVATSICNIFLSSNNTLIHTKTGLGPAEKDKIKKIAKSKKSHWKMIGCSLQNTEKNIA